VPRGARAARPAGSRGRPAARDRATGRAGRGRARHAKRLRLGACADLRRDDDGTWRGRAGDAAFAWTGAQAATLDDRDGVLSLSVTLEDGQSHDLVLTLDAHTPGRLTAPIASGARPSRRVAIASASSRARRPSATRATPTRCCRPDECERRDGRRDDDVTAERARAGRNYDYRYI
jgi:hypothetical protein